MKQSTNFPTLYIKIILLAILTLTSCEKDDSISEGTVFDDPNDPNDDPTNSTGRFSDFISCSIISTPGAVGLNTTYTKYINCSGIPVVGASNVPDEALQIASETMDFMLTGIGAVRNKLISGGAYAILYPEGMSLFDVPEQGGFGQDPNGGIYRYDPNPNVDLNVLITPVYNILCKQHPAGGGTKGDFLVHEFAHMIDIGALRQLDSGFSSNLSSAYNSARSNNLWDNAYAGTNKEEYFAETVMIWYGYNEIGPEGGGAPNRNDIGTRVQLQGYDSGIHSLIGSKLNNLTAVPGCREPVISGSTAVCPETITDIDGNVYEIVNIGPMCWMKENLRTTRYKDGSPIQNISDNGPWENTSNGAWCNYENDVTLDPYGKLYNWYAVSNPAGLCPEGWRAPSLQELQDLVNYSGGDYKSGNLRTTDGWSSNNGSTNSSGFSALPSGKRLSSGSFEGLDNDAHFTSTGTNADQYVGKSIYADQEPVYTPGFDKNYGTSCRCIKD